jgi:hypothetical protein
LGEQIAWRESIELWALRPALGLMAFIYPGRCWSWVGACVLLITEERRVVSWRRGMQMTHIASSAKELWAGRRVEWEAAFC